MSVPVIISYYYLDKRFQSLLISSAASCASAALGDEADKLAFTSATLSLYSRHDVLAYMLLYMRDSKITARRQATKAYIPLMLPEE
jgi:hypothetical protein